MNVASAASCAETAQAWLPTETHEDMNRCAAVTAQNSDNAQNACESILTASTSDGAAAKACTYEEVGDYSSKWDVTVTIVVVAEASMLDASRTTLSLGTSQLAPVALSGFDVGIVYHDIYRNIITANDVPSFRLGLAGQSCVPSDASTTCDAAPSCTVASTTTGGTCSSIAAITIEQASEFIVGVDAYTVKGAVISQSGKHTVSALVSADGTVTQLAQDFVVDVQAVPCAQDDGLYGNLLGNGCLTAYCERGFERTGTCAEAATGTNTSRCDDLRCCCGPLQCSCM